MDNEEANTNNCSESTVSEQATPIASNNVRARKTIKKTTTIQRKKNKCGVCKKMMHGSSLKRHMIRKHSTILNSNQIKKVVCDERPLKDYRKSVACSVCKKTMRSDYLKKHMTAKHNDVLNTAEHQMKPSDAYANKSATNGKMLYKSYDRKVTNATSCASTTMASALHWAFKHVHDETATFLESNGEREASKRITNLLAPIEEQLANMLDQEFNRVANVLILRPTDAESTTI